MVERVFKEEIKPTTAHFCKQGHSDLRKNTFYILVVQPFAEHEEKTSRNENENAKTLSDMTAPAFLIISLNKIRKEKSRRHVLQIRNNADDTCN